MTEPIWLRDELALVLHERLVADFGGLVGVRDQGLLESAMAPTLRRRSGCRDAPASRSADAPLEWPGTRYQRWSVGTIRRSISAWDQRDELTS
jgi:death-on-curing protein